MLFQQNMDKSSIQQYSLRSSARIALLDPEAIVPSRWTIRLNSIEPTKRYAALRANIASLGRNVVPIKVRPAVANGSASYEIVFGALRARACKYLGIPVHAVIQPMDDKTSFVESLEENTGGCGRSLSPYEIGRMLRLALDQGVFPSERSLSCEIAWAEDDVDQHLALSSLPREVLAAFKCPSQIRLSWVRRLTGAVASHPEALKAVAASMTQSQSRPAAANVFKRLTEYAGSTTDGSAVAL